MQHRILIVDDEPVIRDELAEFFESQALVGLSAETAERALELVGDQDFDVILTDIRLPGIDGIEFVRRLHERAPETQVLVMTAHPTVETAVAALRLGAADYVTKPLVLTDLLHRVRRMIEFRAQLLELRWYRRQLQSAYDTGNIIGHSQAMTEVHRLIERAAGVDTPVLITGESGTGKDLVARAIHHNGLLRDKRFVPVNCAAIPAPLVESQLFGHLRGAFTGADQASEGLFAAADGGTLFLDEIGDLPLELQPKLLRAIENREVLPVGATEPIHLDIRIIACTNKDLRSETSAGRFREDLFYRLSVFSIHLPPLRERREEIPVLVEHFIRVLNTALRRDIKGVTNETRRRLLHGDWKGNVRELKNVIERAMILEDDDLITTASLPSTLVEQLPSTTVSGPLKDAIRQFEREYVQSILRTADGDKQLAADLLGISLSSVYRRLQNAEDWSAS